MRKLAVVVLLVVAGTASAEPNVSLEKPTIKGALDAKHVTARVKSARSKLNACYADAVAKDPALTGRAVVKMRISGDGKVTSVAVKDVAAADMKSCVALALSKLTFVPPSDGMPTEVTYPIVLGSKEPGGAFASLTGTGDISSGFDDTNIYGGLLGNDPGVQGLGGLGTPYGPGALKSKNVPTVSIGQPGATGGDLDKAIIRRYIKRNIQKLTYCYEKQLLINPKLKGTVSSEFTIAETGSVTSVTASGVDPEVSACVGAVIKDIEFPKPKNGAVSVKYPFTFRPAGDKTP